MTPTSLGYASANNFFGVRLLFSQGESTLSAAQKCSRLEHAEPDGGQAGMRNHLARDDEDPMNTERAMRGSSAMVGFVRAAGQNVDLRIDPETVLCDLLADLMHWCDLQKTVDPFMEPVDFESALGRARRHYGGEHANERDLRRTSFVRRLASRRAKLTRPLGAAPASSRPHHLGMGP